MPLRMQRLDRSSTEPIENLRHGSPVEMVTDVFGSECHAARSMPASISLRQTPNRRMPNKRMPDNYAARICT
jgi:hypothetical protein